VNGRKILIVDDDEDILLIVQTLLTNAGYAPVLARNGREGIEQATAAQPDVILLDVTMPEISGWEVCATLKNLPETSSIPIVMLTVKSEIRDLITGMQVGADDYITKPFTKRHLLETVERFLEPGEVPRSPFLPKDAGDARTRNLLFDTVSGLPTIPVIVDALREWLLVDHEVGVLFIDFEKYAHIEDYYGWEVFDDVLREAAKALKRLLGTLFSTEDLIAINRPSGSEFYVFLSVPAGLRGDEIVERLQRKARQIEESLRATLSEKFQHRIHRKIGLYVGYAKLLYSPQVRLERLVYRALREAIFVASTKEGERAAILREQFKDVVVHRQIETLYQPLVDLATGAVVAYEALSRGPADSPFENPEVLFDYALKSDQVWALEKICMQFSAERFKGKRPGMLFVNVEAELIHELKSRGHEVLQPLLAIQSGVVLEITERAAIRDYDLFRESVRVLRELGFRIAIDDAGSGYASLQSIAELRPQYLKISNYLVTGLSEDSIKRDVVEMLVRLAQRIDARTVAEGIETEAEKAEVKRLGVTYGQGYLLGRPMKLD
jgi:EAL domain-containing protein (putative c-di-GMP-specific phosphodiesterase class I)/FixJ family two-component response regulator